MKSKNLGFNLLKDTVITNKIVFLRCDLNMPIKNGEIIDDSRLMYAMDTIKYLIKNGSKIILGTHIGRPNGKFDEKYSTKIIADYLNKFVKSDVYYVNTLSGEKVENAIKKMHYGDILVLENLRFDSREESCDTTFAQELSNFCNLYVNEAFSCSHRAHASILGIPLFIKPVAGLRFEEEVEFLTKVTKTNLNPKTTIIGGSKISTKIDVLKNLIPKMNNIFIAGAMANTFIARSGFNVGKSMIEKNYFETVDEINKLAVSSGCNLIIPNSFQVDKDLTGKNTKIKSISEIENDDIILDISPEYIENKIASIIQASKLILWNGPLGMFEVEPYHLGSIKMAEMIAKNKNCISIAGGGDVIAAIAKSKKTKDFSFISTAGGAFLEFIEGKKLAGLEILRRLSLLDKHD